MATARRFALLFAAISFVDCRPGADATRPQPSAAVELATLAEPALDRHIAAHPELGVELGRHEFDGRLPDVSAEGLAAEQARLDRDIAELEAVDEAGLSARERVERAALVSALREKRFEIVELRSPWRNPMFYLAPLDLTAYISRDYAPASERLAAIVAIAEATPKHLQHARANLEAKLPRTFVDTALLQVRGSASFVRTDVPAAMKGLAPDQHARMVGALETMARALDAFAAELESARTSATDEFALGEEKFARMFAQTQGLDVDLATLRAVLQADLDRNVVAMRAAAAQIDPKASVVDVVARVEEDRPAVDAVLQTARAQSVEMRRFLVEHSIVGIPSEDVAEVVETPPFMRWNTAFLNGAGPFERTPLPSFYYISPPDPSWPAQKQREYIPGTNDLLFVTIHEVWPGHFLHALHVKTNPSAVLKSLRNYTMSEGWAHYAEEMMWEAGISDDPRVHVGQLLNALERNVRAMSALGLHTQGWTVEQSKQMFREVAFHDDATAEQQAVRGTFDPMYLSYTAGKLAILKLRADVRRTREAEGKPFDLRSFHDELLSHGAAPLGAIRRAMLGDAAGPPL